MEKMRTSPKSSRCVKFFMLFAFMATIGAMAQDVITLINEQKIDALVQEVGINKVKYKSWYNQTGPTYILKKSEISMIKYQNGVSDYFDEYSLPNDSDKTKPFPAFAIASDRMNILYVNIPNPVSIAASVNPKKLRIDWGGAEATFWKRGRYDVYVRDSLVGKGLTITVFTKTKKGKPKNVEKVTFRVKAVPEPIVFVGGFFTGGSFPKDAILANPFVSAKMGSDFTFCITWTVISYKVTFITIGQIVEEPIIVNGPQFGEVVIDKIKNAPSGTMIIFSEIKIISIAGKRDIQEPIVISISGIDDDE